MSMVMTYRQGVRTYFRRVAVAIVDVAYYGLAHRPSDLWVCNYVHIGTGINLRNDTQNLKVSIDVIFSQTSLTRKRYVVDVQCVP